MHSVHHEDCGSIGAERLQPLNKITATWGIEPAKNLLLFAFKDCKLHAFQLSHYNIIIVVSFYV